MKSKPYAHRNALLRRFLFLNVSKKAESSDAVGPMHRRFSSSSRISLYTLILCSSTFLLIANFSYCQGFAKSDMISGIELGFTHLNKIAAEENVNSAAFKNNFKGNVTVKSVTGTNPIAIRYEYALTNNFGLGISVSWWNVRINVTDEYQKNPGKNPLVQTDLYNFKLSSLSFGIRPNYHFPIDLKKSDLYVGCALGVTRNDLYVDMPDAKTYYEASSPITGYFSPLLGFRFFVTDNFGINLEGGYEKGALLLGGINLRFRPAKYNVLK